MRWVKLHTSLLDNDAWKLLSSDARLTFFVAIALAGKQKQNGVLFVRGVGPMSVSAISEYTKLSTKRQEAALKELISTGGFLYMQEKSYAVSRWSEKAGDDSSERVRKHREKHSGNGDVTLHGRYGNALDKEEEKEQEEDPLRVMARKSDEFSDYLLERGIAIGVVGEHRRLDPEAWRVHNREASQRLVAAYGLPMCRQRAESFFAACKAGRIRNSGGQYPAVRLEAVWEYRELQPVEAKPEDPLMAEFRSLG